jgi:hypothetical protein
MLWDQVKSGRFTTRNFVATAVLILRRTSSLYARDAIHFCIVPIELLCPKVCAGTQS